MKKLLLLICVCAGLFGSSEVAQKEQIVKKVYSISEEHSLMQIGEYYKKLLPYFTPDLAEVIKKYKEEFFCITSSAASGMVEFCPFSTLPQELDKYSFVCQKGKCKIDDIILENYGSLKNDSVKIYAEVKKQRDEQEKKGKKFSIKLKQYEQAKANTAFIQKAIASAKPAKEFLSAELKASFESLDDYVKEVLNEPLGNGNIVGALFFNGLAGLTNYFGFECSDNTCQIVNFAQTAYGEPQIEWIR
ncbi:MAG: hypothetical protein MSA33_05160 [Campylobacter sp.]|uniref:hypothetical protein n=1 Tax=Campylobacter sp. TaxID=205 RepID=UPI002AA7B89A|nr:hypothetical protein [Campylobacter sp.]MCI7549818.1 hypothetical protein [Campylobacter sp.]